MTQEVKKTKKRLRRSFFVTLVSVLISLVAAGSATFAWYIYHTTSKTTKVDLIAGASVDLLISNSYDGVYGYAVMLDSFENELEPVSTDLIDDGKGFQKVMEFVKVGEEESFTMIATYFGEATGIDYYKTTVYLKSTGSVTDVYLNDINWVGEEADNPLSTAVRVGLVPHEAGQDMPAAGEYIFEVNKAHNPLASYNTASGYEGCVLDHTKTDGSVVDFSEQLKSPDNYAGYNKTTGEVLVGENSTKLCTLPVNEDGTSAGAVAVDIYVWLEGCDSDCTNNLTGTILENFSFNFVGKAN